MSAIDDAKSQVEAELRSALGKAVPDATEQAWIGDLAADLAEQKVLLSEAMTDDARARISENLDILNARWKLRLAEKELLASHTAESIMKIAISAAMNVVLPALGPAGGIAKIVIDQVVNRMGATGNG
jgi:hypothetical protein